MRVRHFFTALIFTILCLTAVSAPTYAATTAITGGTNGASCNSGGYFNPSAVTITSGDTVTFSVPSNDPYSGGLEIHGFPQGNFTVATGGSVTTSSITANVSYYGTWPSTGCMKGSGTITVSTPTPPASGGSSSSGSSSPATTTSSGTSNKSTTKSTPTTTPAPGTVATTEPTTTSDSKASATKTTKKVNAKVTVTKKPNYKMLGLIGGGAVLVFAVVLYFITRFIAHRHSQAAAKTMHPTEQLPTPPSGDPTNTKEGNDETHQ